MARELVLSGSHQGKQLARLSRLKWLVVALLVVALLIGWAASRPVQTTDVTETIELGGVRANPTTPAAAPTGRPAQTATSPASAAPGHSGHSAGARADDSAPTRSTTSPAAPLTDANRPLSANAAPVPRLILERRVDGQLLARGQVADAAARDQWLNAIRIGAQGSRVDAAVDVVATPGPITAAPWESRLRQLTALTADRRLSRIDLAGSGLVLEGPAVATSYRQETERLFRAQLPDDYGVVYRTVSPLAPAARAAATAGAAASANPGATGATATGGTAPGAKAPGGGPAAGTPSAPRPAGSAPVREARPAASSADEAKATRGAPANCPARLDKLGANVYFRTDSVAIGRADRERLAELGRCLRNRRAQVIGFADSRQTSQYNLDLSLRRATAVADVIRGTAGANAAITTTAEGAEDGASRRDARLSRRVEIRIR